MLGATCPWKNRCEKYARADKGWKQVYCDSSKGCERCPERPKNHGNEQFRQEADNFQQGQGMGALIVLGLMIFGALKLFGVI